MHSPCHAPGTARQLILNIIPTHAARPLHARVSEMRETHGNWFTSRGNTKDSYPTHKLATVTDDDQVWDQINPSRTNSSLISKLLYTLLNGNVEKRLHDFDKIVERLITTGDINTLDGLYYGIDPDEPINI